MEFYSKFYKTTSLLLLGILFSFISYYQKSVTCIVSEAKSTLVCKYNKTIQENYKLLIDKGFLKFTAKNKFQEKQENTKFYALTNFK